MAELVGGFLMPHVPSIPTGGYGEEPWQKEASDKAFAHISKRVEELEADTVIIVGDDHYENFGPRCIPNCLIATGDVGVSAHAQTLGLTGDAIPNNEELAQHILETGYREGVDWAFAKSLDVDHSVAIPYHMSLKRLGVKAIPVYLNCVVAPLIRSRRAFEIGQSIGRAVESWDGVERVVVFGTGGISHWVGSPGMGFVNEEFDRKVLAMVEAGDIDGLIALPDEVILESAGNGALEIKNWLCAMGALPAGTTAETIAYEPIPTWITGCGFAELKPAA
ncbi:protocatechuate 3,4-dioxygenase [Emcibacter nanhaiensis]|uniref:Protocatechuate 3,4-dioxygenase n=2 Tax=Emcibacter nanhaiensis TaxID=1505037 RepID=A0A501PPW4_9PROT|nr:protocatechuate 3,4-dioxygenase [Emcibacter nanhaiensis]TPD62570.1 protocatechuate 3,4-dioxygenase [Emcibacter nanhaiensis]TPD63809.1 protocatechuate 3,4-dioxygenase [Emcibacter nanhaiensis]TPD63819.1 protocatechuate 3,4-dioxygenase [Emcibacter nanhaiensis]